MESYAFLVPFNYLSYISITNSLPILHIEARFFNGRLLLSLLFKESELFRNKAIPIK